MNKQLWAGMAVLGLALLGALWLWQRPNEAQRTALFQREVATRILASHLAKTFPGKKALIVSNPFTLVSGRPRQIYQAEAAGIKGLKEGFGDNMPSQIGFPELRPEAQTNPESVYVDPQSTTPLSFLVTDHSFDKLFREHPDCAICVSLIGLPLNVTQTESWQKSDSPRFGLLLPDWRVLGNSDAVLDAFKSGKIAAAVMNKPDASPDPAAASSDYQKAFDSRFLLVTPENCEKLARQYRRLF